MTAPKFASSLLGWKASTKNKAKLAWVPNVADVDNLESLTLAAAMLTSLGIPNPNLGGIPTAQPPANPGAHLEDSVRSALAQELPVLDPSRLWEVRRER
ncbi:PDDEXK family nuclease [Kribbella turkmenica]|uniref:hypothetical protein n=1 Tax=Kribbella turkmenica TaxID=2530375 RepID=UPI00192D8163|nr:hypothetical protein [Kribbella turkmenica]